MNSIGKFKNYSLLATLALAVSVTSCKKDEDLPVLPPAEENNPEIFTDIKLIFTDTNNASNVVEARAQDLDGIGTQELEVLDSIVLSTNTTYRLTYEIFNKLGGEPGEDIGAEILEEDNEHQFFFTFSNDAFTNPTGNGNIDTASDPIAYDDKDENGIPVGLKTLWTTSSTTLTDGTFTVKLQHQPNVKTATSGATDGDTDFNLTFDLDIQ